MPKFFFLYFGGRRGGSWLFLYFASPIEKKQHMIAALLLLTVYEGLFQTHQHMDLCSHRCRTFLSGASTAALSTLHQQLLPPPTTTFAARGNSCISKEPKQQLKNVLSKQSNHSPHSSYPVQAGKRKAMQKHTAQHHT